MNSTKPQASVVSRFDSNDILVITASVKGTNISKQIKVENADIESALPVFVKSVFGTQFHEIPKEQADIFNSFDKAVSDYLSNIHIQVETMTLSENLSNEGFHFC